MGSPSCPQMRLKLHALIFSYPGQGHIAPALHLASKLVGHGFFVTFLNSHRQLPSLHQQLNHILHPTLRHHVQLIGLPDGCPLPDPPSPPDSRSFLESVEAMREPFEELVQRLISEELPPCCIIADTFLPWTRHAATRFQLPYVLLWTSAAASFSVFLHMPQILSELARSREVENNGVSVKAEDSITYSVPGLPPLLAADLPPLVLLEDSNHWAIKFFLEQFEHLDEAHSVFVHSCYELEREVFDGIRTAVYFCPVGPLLPSVVFDSNVVSAKASEEDECLKWLDIQPASSVLYISFGSKASLSIDEIHELAKAVEASEHPFLWVILQDSLKGALSDLLPQGFLSNTSERGLIIPWAPQVRVLTHPSVGGFLTHCGWNSTLESICAGVPMIAWPQESEQPINCKFIVDEWKIGMRVRKKDGGLVERRELEEVMRSLMQGEEGKAMRERAKKMGNTVKKAVMEGGSSDANLKTFVDDMLQLQMQQNKRC